MESVDKSMDEVQAKLATFSLEMEAEKKPESPEVKNKGNGLAKFSELLKEKLLEVSDNDSKTKKSNFPSFREYLMNPINMEYRKEDNAPLVSYGACGCKKKTLLPRTVGNKTPLKYTYCFTDGSGRAPGNKWYVAKVPPNASSKKKKSEKTVVQKPTMTKDEKLESILDQSEYQCISKRQKKEKRKIDYELSSILGAFSLSEMDDNSMKTDQLPGLSKSSKAIKKKKKKVKDRRMKKGLRMEEDQEAGAAGTSAVAGTSHQSHKKKLDYLRSFRSTDDLDPKMMKADAFLHELNGEARKVRESIEKNNDPKCMVPFFEKAKQFLKEFVGERPTPTTQNPQVIAVDENDVIPKLEAINKSENFKIPRKFQKYRSAKREKRRIRLLNADDDDDDVVSGKGRKVRGNQAHTDRFMTNFVYGRGIINGGVNKSKDLSTKNALESNLKKSKFDNLKPHVML